MELIITRDTEVSLEYNPPSSSPSFYLRVGEHHLLISNNWRGLDNYRIMFDWIKEHKNAKKKGVVLTDNQIAKSSWFHTIILYDYGTFPTLTLHAGKDKVKAYEYRLNKVIKALKTGQQWVA